MVRAINISGSINTKLDRVILLVLSGSVSLGLMPFVVLRLMLQDWPVAILNSLSLLFCISIFLHVFITKKVQFARLGLAILAIFVMTMTIYLKGPANTPWVYPALGTTFFLLSPLVAVCVSLLFMTVVVVIVFPDVDYLFLLTFLITAGTTFAFLYMFSTRTQEQALFLQKLATTDPLTGIGNRRKLEEKQQEIIQRVARTPAYSCVLILLDMDYFKRINDLYGHGYGDTVLQTFVRVIQSRIRASDFAYRFGGEEFVILLEDTSLDQATLLTKELLKAVAQISWPEQDIIITSLAGIAKYKIGESSYDWLERADKALYQAKENGRNTYVSAADSVLDISADN